MARSARQSRDTLVRAFDSRGSRIGATVRRRGRADNKDAKAGVSIETVEPGGPADKAGIKAGDAVTEFDGERVRSVRQFLRLVQETAPGRSVPVVLSRAGQRVTVNVTPERLTLVGRLRLPATSTVRWRAWRFHRAPPTPPAAPAAPRAADGPPGDAVRHVRRFRNAGRLGVTIEDLDTQLAEYFGVKEGVLVKSVAEDSVATEGRTEGGRRDHVGQRPARLRLVRRDPRDRSHRGQTATSRSK